MASVPSSAPTGSAPVGASSAPKPASSSTSSKGKGKGDTAGKVKAGTQAASDARPAKGSGGKPSVVGHAAKGAATGAGIGATVGSIVPGVGTAIGAGVGAGVGAVAGGAKGKQAKKEWRKAQRTPAQRMLVAEFVACAIILAFSPLTDRHKSDTPADWMKRATGICALFIILGVVAGFGPNAGKVAASFGALVLLVLFVSDRDFLVVITERFMAPPPAGPAGPTGAASEDPGFIGPRIPDVPDSGARPPITSGATTLPGTATRPGRGGYRGYAV